MTLVAIKVNEHLCRGVIATNFTHSFCGSSLIKSLGLPHRELTKPPAVATSDGTPIEFLGEAMVLLELGPWQSEGLIPLLIAFDCPADILIGEDLIKKISQKYPVKFEFYKNAVNIGGTRVSMLDPIPAEEKFISVVVMDPHSQKEVGIENWKKGNKEAMEPGGLVKRRVEVVGQGGGESGGSAMAKMEEENVNNAAVAEEEKAANSDSDEMESKNDASGNTVIEESGKINDEEIGVEEILMEMPKECGETLDELKGKIDIKNVEDGNETKDEGEHQELECDEVEATEI